MKFMNNVVANVSEELNTNDVYCKHKLYCQGKCSLFLYDIVTHILWHPYCRVIPNKHCCVI